MQEPVIPRQARAEQERAEDRVNAEITRRIGAGERADQQCREQRARRPTIARVARQQPRDERPEQAEDDGRQQQHADDLAHERVPVMRRAREHDDEREQHPREHVGNGR